MVESNIEVAMKNDGKTRGLLLGLLLGAIGTGIGIGITPGTGLDPAGLAFGGMGKDRAVLYITESRPVRKAMDVCGDPDNDESGRWLGTYQDCPENCLPTIAWGHRDAAKIYCCPSGFDLVGTRKNDDKTGDMVCLEQP